VRRHEAHPALEQADEEVVEDLSGLLFELPEADPGFFEKDRTHGDGDRADGAAIPVGGEPSQVVEFVLALLVGLRVLDFECRVLA
jgi:hypothetical protein